MNQTALIAGKAECAKQLMGKGCYFWALWSCCSRVRIWGEILILSLFGAVISNVKIENYIKCVDQSWCCPHVHFNIVSAGLGDNWLYWGGGRDGGVNGLLILGQRA